MNAKKARKLRKSLGMTKENHRQKDLKAIDQGVRPFYTRDKYGDLQAPQFVKRQTIVNTNLNFYRKQKKLLNQGKSDE